jgi:ABC-type branched-subunit amino acid transport system substrate-binding protein
MVLRSLGCVAGLLAASACTYGGAPATQPALGGAPPGVVAPAGPPRVAILLPLTGPMAGVAAPMLQAAQLAMSLPGSPVLDVRDTGGDPQRAAAVAQDAIQAGDRLILGPLTAPETATVGAVASGAQIGVLAFTSDGAVASPGVWTLGLTPGQQVRRLVGAARDEGRQHLAALLPQGALGDALQSALEQAAQEAGMETPVVQRSDPGLAGFTSALKTISNYDGRRGELASRIKALRAESDPAARQQAAELAAQPVAAVPFDALLLGVTGPTLQQAAEVLPFYDVTAPQVRVLGPALWGRQAGQLGKLAGGWYAALDSGARQGFVTAFEGKYGAAPSPLADFAFDGAAIAHVLAGENDFSATALTRAEGFTGVDGALSLLPDGHVRRALAVFQIDAGGGATIVSQAPQDVSQPGS